MTQGETGHTAAASGTQRARVQTHGAVLGWGLFQSSIRIDRRPRGSARMMDVHVCICTEAALHQAPSPALTNTSWHGQRRQGPCFTHRGADATGTRQTPRSELKGRLKAASAARLSLLLVFSLTCGPGSQVQATWALCSGSQGDRRANSEKGTCTGAVSTEDMRLHCQGSWPPMASLACAAGGGKKHRSNLGGREAHREKELGTAPAGCTE